MRTEMTWAALRPLPRVAPWNKGKRSYTWEQRRDDYAALPKTPIIITAELVTPILHAERERTHIDGILSAEAPRAPLRFVGPLPGPCLFLIISLGRKYDLPLGPP